MGNPTEELASAIAAQGGAEPLAPSNVDVHLRQAVVQSVQASSVTIQLAGSTTNIAGVKALNRLPAAGSTVWVAQVGPMLLILGAQASSTGIGCEVTRTTSGGAAQSFANTSFVDIDLFDAENDPYGFHAASANTLVVPPGLGGWYTAVGECEWAPNGTGGRTLQLKMGGVLVGNDRRAAIAGGDSTTNIAVGQKLLADGDVVKLTAQQTSGGALALSGTPYSRLTLVRHG